MRRGAGIVAGLVAALAGGFATASADGEIGLVIQIGDDVQTHCVAYSGDSITGEQALFSAGYSVEQLGGGTRAVCAIDDVGCFDASSFSSCFCECQGRECTYWAFFTREYGAGWVYSTLGFNLLQATDGDVHGWKWGAGGPSSAPSPVDVTFEQICGHSPQSLNPPTATATATATRAATTATSAAGSPTSEPATTEATASSAATATVSSGASATASASATSASTEAPSVVVTIGHTPAPPDTAGPNDDGGGNGGLIAAGAIGVALLAAIGGAAVWRVRHGS